MKQNLEGSTRTPRRIRGHWKVLIASGLALGGIFASALPAEAVANVNWYNIGCNYGYYIALHSDGTDFVQHTMRQTGSDSSTNKFKTWQNGILGAVRVWGYGYQNNSFAQVYSSNIWWERNSQYWYCS